MPERTKCESVAERVARYRPSCLPERLWLLAGSEVRAAVLATDPRDAEDAKGLLSRCSSFLAGPCGWDRMGAPDLAPLLTGPAIRAHVERLRTAGKARRTRENHRGDLHRLAAAAAGLPPVRPPRGVGVPAPSGDAVLARLSGAQGQFAGMLVAGVPLGLALAVHERRTGTTVTEAALARLVPAVRAAAAGTVDWVAPGLVEAGDLLTREVRATNAQRAVVPAPPRRSRAAVLRAAKASLAAVQAAVDGPVITPGPDPAGLDPQVVAAIEAYRPQGLPEARWAELRRMYLRLVYGARPVSANSARNLSTAIVGFLAWVADRPGRADGPLTLGELLTPRLVEAWQAASTAPDSAKSAARSAVRRALRSLDPSGGPTRLAHQPVAAPYDAQRCADLVRLARNQPTPARRRELSALVALGLGAGLDGGDQREVTADDVAEQTLPDGTTVLVVTVRGRRPRVVPVRRRCQPLLAEALAAHRAARLPKGTPLLGGSASRRNVTTPVLDRAVTATGTGVDIEVNRLRSTWLVAALAAPVPLAALLTAAGLSTARTLTDLLPYVPASDPVAVAALLADLDTGGAS